MPTRRVMKMLSKSMIELEVKSFGLDTLVEDNCDSHSLRYPELISIFERYTYGIRDEVQRDYYSENAAKILSNISRNDIPQRLLTGLLHPEMIPYVRGQEDAKNSCGTSCVRTVLLLNYGIMFSEQDMWKLMKETLDVKSDIKDGTSPMQIAGIMRHVHSKEKLHYKNKEIRRLKFFMSCRGDLEQLTYWTDNGLLPIINRPRHENNWGNHYEVVLGVDKNFVYMHNPANYASTSGFHKCRPEEFMSHWWLNTRGNYRWYITAVPETENSIFNLTKSASKHSPAFIGKYA